MPEKRMRGEGAISVPVAKSPETPPVAAVMAVLWDGGFSVGAPEAKAGEGGPVMRATLRIPGPSHLVFKAILYAPYERHPDLELIWERDGEEGAWRRGWFGSPWPWLEMSRLAAAAAESEERPRTERDAMLRLAGTMAEAAWAATGDPSLG